MSDPGLGVLEVLTSYGEATNKEAEALKGRVLAAMKVKKEAQRKEALEATIVRPLSHGASSHSHA